VARAIYGELLTLTVVQISNFISVLLLPGVQMSEIFIFFLFFGEIFFFGGAAVTVRINFILFIPRIIDNCFTTLNQEIAHNISLDIYHVTLTFVHVSTPKGSSLGKETKAALFYTLSVVYKSGLFSFIRYRCSLSL